MTSAHAATYIWSGAGFFGTQDFLWSNDFNWVGGAAPSAGETNVAIIFPNSAAPRLSTNDINGLNVVTVWFVGSNYVVHGKPTGNALGLKGNPGGTWTIAANADGCQFAGTSPLSLVTSGTVSVSTGATVTLAAQVYGPGGLAKDGPGTCKLSAPAANLYSGGTTVVDGTLDLGCAGNAIPGKLTIGGTNQNLAPLVRLQADNQIATAPIFMGENSRLWLNGYDDTVGSIALFDGAEINMAPNGGFVGPGLLTLNGNITNFAALYGHSAKIEGRIGLGGATRIIASDAFLEVTAEISGSGGVTLTGPGTVSFSASNSYSGLTWVQGGKLNLFSLGTPGSTASGTVVDAGAALDLREVQIGSEPLAMSGVQGDPTLFFRGTNVWAGPVTLSGPCSVNNFSGIGVVGVPELTFSGALSGAGSLTKEGAVRLRFTGTSANTFSGSTVVNRGELQLGKTGVTAISGALAVNGLTNNSTVRLLQPHQIHDQSAVELNGDAWLRLEGNNEAIGSLAGNGRVDQTAGQTGILTVGGNGGSTTFDGLISGGGALTKTGVGTFSMTGNNLYTGPTTVNGGKLLVFGQQPQSLVTIQSGASLGGTGRVGNLSDASGHVAPGGSPGILACGNYSTLNSANLLQFEINGSAPGTGYDQLQVHGSVLLTAGTPQLTMNFSGAVSNQYVLISNDGVDPVSGTFTGLPEGAFMTNSGAAFQITYHGGDGNDVVLKQMTAAFASQISGGTVLPNGRFAFTAIGVPNTTYRVDACTNLAPTAVWTQIGTVVADGAGGISFSDANSPLSPMRFYRLRHP